MNSIGTATITRGQEFDFSAHHLRTETGVRTTGSVFTNSSAIKLFNAYHESIGEPKFHDLPADYFDDVGQAIQIKLRNWSIHLMRNVPLKKNGQPLGPESVKNYYGLVKTRLRERYPRHDCWKPIDGESFEDRWFKQYQKEIYDTLTNRINKGDLDADAWDVFDNHIAFVLKHSSIVGLEDVPDWVTILREVRMGTGGNNGAQWGAILAVLWAAGGRSGEPKHWHMKTWRWDDGLRALVTKWRDVKTSKEKRALFSNMFRGFEACVLDNLGDYWNVDNGLLRIMRVSVKNIHLSNIPNLIYFLL